MYYCEKIENYAISQCTDDKELAKELGWTKKADDIERGYDGRLYVAGHTPTPPDPTKEEQKEKRELAYTNEVDPITCHINRLRDQNPVPEDEIAELIAERDEKVEEIKARYPYPEENE